MNLYETERDFDPAADMALYMHDYEQMQREAEAPAYDPRLHDGLTPLERRALEIEDDRDEAYAEYYNERAGFTRSTEYNAYDC